MATLPVLLAATSPSELICTQLVSQLIQQTSRAPWLLGCMGRTQTKLLYTIYGMQYSVEPGPCGVTVPHLYAPKCSTPDTTVAPTEACHHSHGNCPSDHSCCCNGRRTRKCRRRWGSCMSQKLYRCRNVWNTVKLGVIIILLYIVPYTHRHVLALIKLQLFLLPLKVLKGATQMCAKQECESEPLYNYW